MTGTLYYASSSCPGSSTYAGTLTNPFVSIQQVNAQSLSVGDGVAFCFGDTFWGNNTGITIQQSNITYGSYECRSGTTNNPILSFGYALQGCVYLSENALVQCINPNPSGTVAGVWINNNPYVFNRYPPLTNPYAPWGESDSDFWYMEEFAGGYYVFTFAQQGDYISGYFAGGALRARDSNYAYNVFFVESSDPTYGISIADSTWGVTPAVNWNGWYIDGAGDTFDIVSQVGQYWAGNGGRSEYIFINPLTLGDQESLISGTANAGIVFVESTNPSSCLLCIKSGDYNTIANLTLQYVTLGIYMLASGGEGGEGANYLTIDNTVVNHITYEGISLSGAQYFMCIQHLCE